MQQLELGYLLTAKTLAKTDAELTAGSFQNISSIRTLAGTSPGGLSFPGLLRGPLSLGAMLEDAGYPAAPSDVRPSPDTTEPFFEGGFNTYHHTSRLGGSIDGVQIECHFNGVRNNSANRAMFADSLSVVMLQYLRQHYFSSYAFTECSDLHIVRGAAEQAPKLFPNPAPAGRFRLGPVAAVPRQTALIYDVCGRVVEECTRDGAYLVPASPLPPGVYTVRVASSSGSRAYRLVVQ